MIVVPVIVMPALILGIISATRLSLKKTPQIMLLGGEGSPETAAALRAMSQFEFVPASADYTNQIAQKKIRAAVEIPRDFDAAIAAERKTTVHIYVYASEPQSMIAAGALEKFFQGRREAVVQRHLAERRLPETLVAPFSVVQTNVASPRQVSGVVIGMVLPYLMIIMCLTGTIYPAVDLTAGEKERGTLETLLCSPVSRTHLVLGKGLVVLTVLLLTALLALGANGTALLLIKSADAKMSALVLDPLALAGVCVLIVPLAIFFAALTVAIGLFARSAKEANTYLQPLIFLAIARAVAAMLPGVEFNYRFAAIPVLNMSLLCKEVLSGNGNWSHALVVFAVMSLYAGLAVAAAVALFKRESVLFRS